MQEIDNSLYNKQNTATPPKAILVRIWCLLLQVLVCGGASLCSYWYDAMAFPGGASFISNNYR